MRREGMRALKTGGESVIQEHREDDHPRTGGAQNKTPRSLRKPGLFLCPLIFVTIPQGCGHDSHFTDEKTGAGKKLNLPSVTGR